MASGSGVEFPGGKDDQSFLLALKKFALELYKSQRKKSAGNIFMSPFSISVALGMTALGARKKTLEEMKKTLSFNDLADSAIHQGFGDITKFLENRGQSAFELNLANRLFAENSFQFLDEFLDQIKKFYASEIEGVSFSKETDAAITKINTWVEEKTKEKIKNLVSRDTIKPSTLLVIVNAIYFKGFWHSQFQKHETKEADFHVSEGETIKVQMMYQKMKELKYFHSEDLNCQIVKLPYKSEVLSMVILLPDKPKDLEKLENNLTADSLAKIDTQCSEAHTVNVWLPKFKMEESLTLAKVLQDMGMKSLFGAADLSGIDGKGRLAVTEVVHKAFVDVNEEGTEAAAATVVRGLGMSRHAPPPPIDFRADRPFLFFIQEETTKAILFLGRAIKPQHS